jgi:murein DD-endopeptidase MepM/ murein hydrolase activator NlpD
MPNPYRIVSLAFIAACSIGGVSLMGPPRIAEPIAEKTPTLGVLYAAPVETVETHVLRNGQTLGGVFAQARMTSNEMADLLLGLRQHINPRQLRDDTEITVRRWSRSDEPRSVDVRVNADSTIRLVKSETSWDPHVVVTPTLVDTVYAGGEIRNTLYETIVFDEQSRLPIPDRRSLVYELASVYEYKLDFTREIQPGDSYRMVYVRQVRPDGSSRSKKIIAAEMITSGKSHQAFWFEGSSEVRGYFDEQARPLAVGFSRYPVEFPRITSNFNPNRYHPILKTVRAHVGTDFGAPTGTPVMSTAQGTVTFAGVNSGYGNMVEIRHFNGYTTRYAHLSRFAAGIRPGTKVSQKQVIGYVGATGLATAPHLHYELRVNGQPVNARTAKLPDTPPIPGSLRTQFMAIAEARASLLERIPAGSFYADASSGSVRSATAAGAL